jgi:DNA (cytosine-5)-methyltransferase 1
MSTRQKLVSPALSMFSGAMGLDLGLEQHGFCVRVAVENNRAAVETIKQNRPDIAVIDRSIADVCTDEILKEAKLKASEIVLISAGPCCQSFSTAGKRHSIADPRGNLFYDFCRVVREVRPRFFVMENVKGLLSAAVKHRPLNERGAGFPPLTKEEQLGSALKLIRAELAKLNYHVIFDVLNAADFGVPQKRLRVIFIGSRDGEEIRLPRPTHADPKEAIKKKLLPWVTLRKGLRGVVSKEWAEFSEQRLAMLKMLKPGQNWRDLPEHLHRDALGAAADSWGGRGGFCRRLAWNEPAPTLTTAPDGRATTLCHPRKDRPLSVEEYAVLQQFPTIWQFSGSIHQKYMQIGNAVPIGLGAAIGKELLRTIRKTAKAGLPREAAKRRGNVTCADPEFEERLKKRKKTQLHPPHLRKINNAAETRKWLIASV